MLVKVTEQHIRDGVRCETGHCPVALALSEIFPNMNIFVDCELIKINMKEYETPLDVYNFIIDFDIQEEVKPFEFELDYENPSNAEALRCGDTSKL